VQHFQEMMDNNSASFDLSAPAMKMLSSQKAMPITKKDAEVAKLKKNNTPVSFDALSTFIDIQQPADNVIDIGKADSVYNL
jgi:hypothetical protein